MDAKQLYSLGEDLFSKRLTLTSLWQETASNFYPERADFTVRREMGDNFADNLMSSYPILVRRDLGNQFSSMLRPTAREWFHPKVRYLDKPDNETKVALEFFQTTQRRAMYDPKSMFTRATKEGDHDYATFGQNVISIELNKQADGLLYRCWHLRDVAWEDDEDGQVGAVFRRWKPTIQTAIRTFGDKVHENITKNKDKTPFAKCQFMHMVVRDDMYDDNANGKPRFSIWYDYANDKIIEVVPIWGKHYVIPRWQTVSGSQYSYSPATIAALPDARLLQAMTYTLLEAGEKATNPPIIATQDAVRSDVAVYAGGITWVDQEYDERLGNALRPVTQDLRGLAFGANLNEGAMQMLSKAFFLDTLTMPPVGGPEMTAYEVGKRVEEWVRNALPIFEPTEANYNAALCDETFDLMWRNGAFGDPRTWPESLRGSDIDFTFESPLHDAIDQQKATKFRESQALIAEAVALDPALVALPKAEVALRDALEGIGTPAHWLNSEADVAEATEKAAQAAEARQQLDMMQQGAAVANELGTTEI